MKDALLRSRIIALVIDHFAIYIILAIISIFVGTGMVVTSATTGFWEAVNGEQLLFWTYFVLAQLISFAYFTFLEGSSGRTIGKRMTGIRVVTSKGKGITYREAYLRTLGRFVDGLFFYLVGFLLIILTKKGLRLGDRMAGTRVVPVRDQA